MSWRLIKVLLDWETIYVVDSLKNLSSKHAGKITNLKVFVEIATIPSGHCSLENPAAYSKVS